MMSRPLSVLRETQTLKFSVLNEGSRRIALGANVNLTPSPVIFSVPSTATLPTPTP